MAASLSVWSGKRRGLKGRHSAELAQTSKAAVSRTSWSERIRPTRRDRPPRPEGLEAAIGPRMRLLVLTNPNNPTGTVYTVDELAALAVVVRSAEGRCTKDYPAG